MDNVIGLETMRESENVQKLRSFLLQQIATAHLPNEDDLWREQYQAQDNSNDNTRTAEQSFQEWYQYLESLGISSEAEPLPIPDYDNIPHQPSVEGFNRIYQSLQELKK